MLAIAAVVWLGYNRWMVSRIDTGRAYRVGIPHDPPLSVIDAAGRPDGFAVEVISEAARRSGIRLEWALMPAGPDKALRRREVDLWPLLTIRPDRKPHIQFTQPWMHTQLMLISTSDPDAGSTKDAVIAFSDNPINRQLFAGRYRGAVAMPTNGQDAAVLAVCDGRASAALVSDRTFFASLLRRPAGCERLPFHIAPVPDSRTSLAIASTVAAAPVARLLRAQIDGMEADGSLGLAFKRWSLLTGSDIETLQELSLARYWSHFLAWGLGGAGLLLALVVWEGKNVRRARRSAESASAAKSEFLANISHEIRTPLNGVIGMTELLAGSGLSEPQLEMASVVQASADTLLALVNDLLDFSRIESGQLSLEWLPFPAAGMVAHVAEVMRPRCRAKSLVLETAIDPALPSLLLGDELRLRQVLLNLVGNAVKFTETGTVRISVTPAGEPENPFAVLFSISDTGIGIHPETQRRLFQPFVQADSATTRRYGGTGLGLAISRKLVQSMGGSIGVDSRPGEGSTFWFVLPLREAPPLDALPAAAPLVSAKPAPPAAGAAVALPEAARGILRVLIAEDNPVNQAVALRAVRKLGYAADTVANGLEVLDALEQEHYDVILMDCQMPEMDGYQATAEIRRRKPGSRHIPILALTANAVQGDQERCLEAGMDDYIAKPVRIAALATALERWTRGAAASATG